MFSKSFFNYQNISVKSWNAKQVPLKGPNKIGIK